MTPPDAVSNPDPISRREAIRRTALLLGVAVSPSWLACVDRRPDTTGPVHLAAPQFALAAAIAERILPRTDTPGAGDVGVPAFLDRLYGEFMTPDEQQRFAAGLDEVEAASTAEHRVPFVSLAADQQDALLTRIARASQDQDTSFFAQMRAAVVLGYFTAEEVGRNVLHYLPVPGRYDPCLPIEEVGRRNWTT